MIPTITNDPAILADVLNCIQFTLVFCIGLIIMFLIELVKERMK